MTTTTNSVDAVKAALRVVEQKRAIKNRLEKQAETKIAEAKAKAEKQYADKITAAETELEVALEAFRTAAEIFKNGAPVEAPADESEELNEAI